MGFRNAAILLLFISEILDGLEAACRLSNPTIQYVSACPRNEKEWKEASRRKKCADLAAAAVSSQCVSNGTDFQYHCVINHWINATLEVCAGRRFIQDYCVDYNTQLEKITENYDAKCSAFQTKCPTRYISTDAYKYQDCYGLVLEKKKQMTTKRADSMPNTNTPSPDPLRSSQRIYVSWAIAASAALLLVGTVFIWRKAKRICMNCCNTNDNEIGHRKGEEVRVLVCPTKDDNEEEVPGEIGHRKGEEVRVPLVCPTKDDNEEEVPGEIGHRKSEEVRVPHVCPTKDDNEGDGLGAETGHPKGEEVRIPLVCPTKDDNEKEVPGAETGHPKGEEVRVPLVCPTKDDNEKEVPGDTFDTLKRKSYIREQTESYLKGFEKFDAYYFPVAAFSTVEEYLETQGMVTIVGPPGVGKTATAIHILRRYVSKSWNVRKILTHGDLTLPSERNTLLFIDDFFMEQEEIFLWTTAFKDLENMISKRTDGKRIYLLITADHISRHLRGLKMFQNEVTVEMSSRDLTYEEKLAILDNQMNYANKFLKVEMINLDEDLKDEIAKAKTAIGFPLCAQLFAREPKNRKGCASIFTDPKNNLQYLLKERVNKNRSALTTLILLFLQKTYSGEENVPSEIKAVDLYKEDACGKALSQNLVTEFDLSFKNLVDAAMTMRGLFLMKTEHSFTFLHGIVYEAAGSLLFGDEYFNKSVATFPLIAISKQLREFSIIKKEKYKVIAERLLREIRSRNLSEVCKCSFLKNDDFIDALCSEMNESDEKTTIRVFDKVFYKLPMIFWTNRFSLEYFSQKIYELTDKYMHVKNTTYWYYALLGAFSSDLASDLNCEIKANSIDVLKHVLFEKKNSTVVHKLIVSSRTDKTVASILDTLIEESVVIDKENEDNRTPLMLAVRCKKDRRVTIERLAAHSDLKAKDRLGYTVFHHCVFADKDDRACCEILDILLKHYEKKYGNFEEIDSKTHSGHSVLHLAAIHEKFSRIHCMQILLGLNTFDQDTVDRAKKSPIHNMLITLKGDNVFVELERLLRVCMLIIYRFSPYTKAENRQSAYDVVEHDQSGAFKTLKKLIEANPDKEEMLEILTNVFSDIPKDDEKLDIDLPLSRKPEELDESLLKLMRRSVPHLCNKNFMEIIHSEKKNITS